MTEIGKAYGNALFLLAQEEGLDGDILEQLGEVCSVLRENQDYVRLMMTPTLKKTKRLEILAEAFDGKVHEYLFNFMCILVDRNGFEEIFGACEEYRRLYNDAHGIMEVTAYTAVALSSEQAEALKNKIASVTGKKVELSNKLDPLCIGGVRLESEGKRLDGSVKSRLEAIRESLLNAKA